MGDLRNWIVSLGSLGPLVFIVIYIVAVAAAIPGSALTVTAGALFGSVLGADAVTKGLTRGEVPWVLVGALAGIAVVLFVLVRFAREKL